MQWDGSTTGGFTTGQPWLPLSADVATVNVVAERDDPASMLNLHRRLLELRRSEPALSVGDYAPLAATGNVLAYERRHGDRRVGVVLNLGLDPQPWTLPDGLRAGRALLTASGADAPDLRDEATIAGDEAIVFELA
jgi:glycosidase